MAKQQLSRRQQRKQSRTNNRKNKSQKRQQRRTRKNHQRRRMRGGSNNNEKKINEKKINEKKIPGGYDRILCIYYTSNTLTNPTITSHYIKENNTVPNDLKYEFDDERDETNVKRVTLRENGENFKIVYSLIKSINPESSKGNEGSERVEHAATEEGKQGNAEEEGKQGNAAAAATETTAATTPAAADN